MKYQQASDTHQPTICVEHLTKICAKARLHFSQKPPKPGGFYFVTGDGIEPTTSGL
jgi:hypothetical protein